MTIEDAAKLLKEGDWQAAHQIVQEDQTALGAWAHGIVHMLEGDIANAGYWYRRAERKLPPASDADREIEALLEALNAD